MTKPELTERILCSVGGVSNERAKKGQLTTEDWKKLWDARKFVNKSNIFVDDTSVTTVPEILSKCRRLKALKGRLDLVVVDHIQLMEAVKKSESRQAEITEISRGLKMIAKELNCPVIALSQLSRLIERRSDQRPVLSDLRESGAIEQDADIIMFLHREHNPNDQSVDEDTRTKCDIIVAKHRNGSTDTVTVRWHGEYTTFTDLYEKSDDRVVNITEPTFKNNFIGVDETPTPEEPKVELPPIDSIAEPTRPAKRTAEPAPASEPAPGSEPKPERASEYEDLPPVDGDVPPEPDNAPPEDFVSFEGDPFNIPFGISDTDDDDLI
jgi:hypothetical protein